MSDRYTSIKFGVNRTYGRGEGTELYNRTSEILSYGALKQLKSKLVEVNGNVLPGFNKDANNNGTLDSFDTEIERIPANTIIKAAYLMVYTAPTGTGTLNIGTYKEDGTVIDLDGLDAALNAAALSTGYHAMDGALVGKKVGDFDNFIKAAVTGDLTGFDADIIIEFA